MCSRSAPDNSLSVMVRFLVTSVLCLFLAFGASLATLLIPVQVATPEAAKNVPLGWPATFVRQDLSAYDPPTWPNTYSINAPQEHPVVIHLGWFVFNMASFAGAFFAASVAIRKVLARHKQ